MWVGRGGGGPSSHLMSRVGWWGGWWGAGRAGPGRQGEGERWEAGGERGRRVGGQVVEEPLREPDVDLWRGEEEGGGLVGAAGVPRLELLQVLEGRAREQPPALGHLVQVPHGQLLETANNQSISSKKFWVKIDKSKRQQEGVECLCKLISPGCRPSRVLTHFPPRLAGRLKHRR